MRTEEQKRKRLEHDRANKDKINAKQREYHRKRMEEGRPKNRPSKKAIQEYNKERREKLRAVSHSLMTPCVDCGAFDVRFMDWHHRDPATKTVAISTIVATGRKNGAELIKEEVAKCDCLCSNCHRIRHSDM